MTTQLKHASDPLVVKMHHHEIVIRQRYEVASIINDVLIGLWFLIGSFMFLTTSLVETGTWLFVVGSIEMLIRPVISLTRRIHLQRIAPDWAGATL